GPGLGNGEVLAVPARAHVEGLPALGAAHVVGGVEVVGQGHGAPRRVVVAGVLRPRHVGTGELPLPVEVDLLPGTRGGRRGSAAAVDLDELPLLAGAVRV